VLGSPNPARGISKALEEVDFLVVASRHIELGGADIYRGAGVIKQTPFMILKSMWVFCHQMLRVLPANLSTLYTAYVMKGGCFIMLENL
jgi:hypothetical protein